MKLTAKGIPNGIKEPIVGKITFDVNDEFPKIKF